MSALQSLIDGLGSALTPMNLMWVLIGVTLGTIVGILPGLGNPAAVLAVLLPLTLKLPPTTGLIAMAGLPRREVRRLDDYPAEQLQPRRRR
jgi:putative tricarboxylic transport membrane protein